MGVTDRENTNPIDVVVTYVNGGDPQWIAKKNSYQKQSSERVAADVNETSQQGMQDTSASRYRDWDTLRYVLRSIEKYAPFVRNIYLVTDNQVPEWIDDCNARSPRLICVNHTDFIPKQYLPVFNADAIEIHLHRIPGISDRFLLLDDDFFFTGEVRASDFFEGELPKDIFMEYPIGCGGNNEIFSHMLASDFNLIGRHFKRSEYKKRLRSKILSLRYGSYFFYNLMLYLLPFPNFFGLITPHFMYSFRKKDFEEVWEVEGARLERSAGNRFRQQDDVSSRIFRFWYLMKGEFVPYNKLKRGRHVALHSAADVEAVKKAFERNQITMLCINDECDEAEYDRAREEILALLEREFPEKSSFEK